MAYVAQKPAAKHAADKKEPKNEVAKYAAKMMTSQVAQSNGLLWSDYQLLTKGHAVYLPHFFCAKDDFALLKSLATDLEKSSTGMISWSQHLKHENPTFSPTFQLIVKRLDEYFDVEIFATRLNFYPDSTSWKPFHHDSHAYGGHAVREDFTMGASFGATRELVFMHPPTQQQFTFPQANGDIFSFTTTVNQRFMHGVPRAQGLSGSAPRFSVIAWGKRRSINPRNAGSDELLQQREPKRQDRTPQVSEKLSGSSATDAKEPEKEIVMEIKAVTELVEKFVISQTQQKATSKALVEAPTKNSRVQGGWAANQSHGKPFAKPNMGHGGAIQVAVPGPGRGGGWAAAMGARQADPVDGQGEDDNEEGDDDQKEDDE